MIFFEFFLFVMIAAFIYGLLQAKKKPKPKGWAKTTRTVEVSVKGKSNRGGTESDDDFGSFTRT